MLLLETEIKQGRVD